MPHYQQELVLTRITTGDTALTPVETTGYSINYQSFITLGNTNDTVTLDINGVTGLTFSMIGKVDMSISSISVRSVERNTTTPAPAPYIGILVVGVKRYKNLFGNTMFT